MFKIAKLEKVNNEKVIINLAALNFFRFLVDLMI